MAARYYPPKTATSKRSIPIPAALVSILRAVVAAVLIAVLIAITAPSVKSQYQRDQPPDVTSMFVYPEQPALVITNESANIAREIKFGVVLWNPDTPRLGPLPIPFQTFDFIRPH
jgi:hypothetical protein